MLTGEAAQTTVSQTSVFLHVLQFLHVQTQLQRTTHRGLIKQPFFRSCLFHSDKKKLECLCSDLVHGFITGILQCQVHHGVLESAAHVELKGDVVHTLRFGEKRGGANHYRTEQIVNIFGDILTYDLGYRKVYWH